MIVKLEYAANAVTQAANNYQAPNPETSELEWYVVGESANELELRLREKGKR